MNKYFLRADGTVQSQNRDLVDYIAQRYNKKNEVWEQRNNVLTSLADSLNKLINIYYDNTGNIPKDLKTKTLYYRSALAHQAWNVLMATKLEPDFIDFAPLGVDFDKDLLEKAKELTQAHKIMRYRGGYEKAKQEAKKDFIWGNSFIQLGISYNENNDPDFVEYTHAPFREMRSFYGDTDIMRVIDYPVEVYAGVYGEDMLRNVSMGDILTTTRNRQAQSNAEEGYEQGKDRIQVIFYYDPFRKIFGEIHGGNGYIYQNFEGDQYPFLDEQGKGFAPFKESRFYEPTSDSYFGWGVMDYLIDLANLETTITNATSFEAIWDASAPSFVYSNDPDDMERKLDRFYRDRNRGVNRPIVQKDSGIGTRGKIEQIKKGVDNQNMQVWDETTISRATRFSNIDFQSLSEYAPTAEQQKLKKIESDKLNLRVLLLNEEREKEFAIKEVAFLQNGKTRFHNQEIEIIDDVAEKYQTAEGYKPAIKKKIKDILTGIKNLNLKIVPRMEGALSDQTFLEIQTLQEDFALIPPGSQAQFIALEKYFAKKNPDLGLGRTDFLPSMPGQNVSSGGMEQMTGATEPTEGLTKQLSLAL